MDQAKLTISAVPSALKVDESDADLDFGGLAVGVRFCVALYKHFHALYLGRDPASGMVAGPALLERAVVVSGGAQAFVSGDCGWSIFFPESAVLASWDDWGGLPMDDDGVASAVSLAAAAVTVPNVRPRASGRAVPLHGAVMIAAWR
jgi:hypothetical protein